MTWLRITKILETCLLGTLILFGCTRRLSLSRPEFSQPPGQPLKQITHDRISFRGHLWYLFGVNYPWINYAHDFGSTEWGHNGVSAVSAQWWGHQTKGDSQGVRKVACSTDRARKGAHSLKLITILDGRDRQLKKGEAFVDLRYHAPDGQQGFRNLEGATLRCWIFAPPGSGGYPSAANGLQLFVKDADWRSEYGTWANIVEGEWNLVTLTVARRAPRDGWMDQGFDPTRVVMIGVKVAINDRSTARYDGAFYVDAFDCNGTTWFDFENRTVAEEDFETLSGCGIRVVRWFLFGDGRASPEFDNNGRVIGFDQHFYDDMDAALVAAEKHDVYLIPVLFDFHLCDQPKNEKGVQLGGRSDLIADPQKRRSFLEQALKPLLARYGRNRRIIAWDIMNEPEGAMDIPGGKWEGVVPVSAANMQAFVDEIARCIHTHSEQFVTVGSASRAWLALWTNSPLDFVQYHHYDQLSAKQGTPFDARYEQLGLTKPCILGEFPTKGSEIDVRTYLEKAWTNGLAGALAWSFRAGDEFSEFSCEAFREWRAHHANATLGTDSP